MPATVINFYKNGWYQVCHPNWKPTTDTPKVNKNSKKAIKSATEFLTLFMDQHVPVLPLEAANALSPEARKWRMELEAIIQNAWDKAKLFIKEQLPQKAPSLSVSVFEKNMKAIDPDLWPEGPSHGADSFGFIQSAASLRAAVMKNKKTTKE